MEVKLKVIRETEKAVLVNAITNSYFGTRSGASCEKDIWLPKSQIKISDDVVTFIPKWLADKKDISVIN